MGAGAVFIGDPAVSPDPSWTAYVVESAAWSPSVDPGYSPHDTNVIPVPGNPTNTVVQPNSLQTGLPYWVKIRHKTEYDAERAGHRPATPHYVDLDGSTSGHSKSNRGNVLYFGYPSTASTLPVSFTTNVPTPWLPIEKIVAYGAATEGTVVLEEEVVHPPGPNQLGALHASGDVSLTGASGTINGHDACGVVRSLPPVVYGGTFTSTPTMQFDGNPASPRHSSHVPGPAPTLVALNTDAVTLNADQINQHLGTALVPMTFLRKAGLCSTTRNPHSANQGIRHSPGGWERHPGRRGPVGWHDPGDRHVVSERSRKRHRDSRRGLGRPGRPGGAIKRPVR